MHNIEAYETELYIYIVVIAFIGLIIFLLINLIFLILKKCKLFDERKVWILADLAALALPILLIVQAGLDIYHSAYCTIENVVNIEVDFVENNSSKYILITDASGEVYTCYDYLIDTESLENVDYPGTAVYTKYSNLLLRYYYSSEDSSMIDSKE